MPLSANDSTAQIFNDFIGHWGFFDPDQENDMIHNNGPSGPPHRAADDGSENGLQLKENPRRLHNEAIRTAAPNQVEEMWIPVLYKNSYGTKIRQTAG